MSLRFLKKQLNTTGRITSKNNKKLKGIYIRVEESHKGKDLIYTKGPGIHA